MPDHASHIAAVGAASYPLRDGNAVRPLVDGATAFLRIAQAVRSAQQGVWVTVAFLETQFRLPEPYGSFFDLLDEARERGLDVRVIFWRSPEMEHFEPGTHFPGTPAQHQQLADRGSRFRARWDRLPRFYCHHQKSWLIDAGAPTEVAFVGGINLDRASLAPVGHPPQEGGSTHDVYLELRGPAATDVHHNFVQRWNEASERREPDGVWPADDPGEDLPFPTRTSPVAGDARIQVSRTVRRGCYSNGTATPGGVPFPIAAGEASVLAQYLVAIGSARRSIYIEDQVIASLPVIDALGEALERGVDVVFLVPATANALFAAGRRTGRHEALVTGLAGLACHPRFTLAGLVTNRPGGGYEEVYVHAKIALVDDAWLTIGSANVANRSFHADTELNASVWHGETTRLLRTELLREHLGVDTAERDDRGALRVFAAQARRNADRRSHGETLEGLAVALDPGRYGA